MIGARRNAIVLATRPVREGHLPKCNWATGTMTVTVKSARLQAPPSASATASSDEETVTRVLGLTPGVTESPNGGHGVVPMILAMRSMLQAGAASERALGTEMLATAAPTPGMQQTSLCLKVGRRASRARCRRQRRVWRRA